MSIADYLFSTLAEDVVGIYLQGTYLPIFSEARAIKARVNKVSNIMTHPVEDGTVVADHKVINPTEIEISFILSSDLYRITYEAINYAFKESLMMTVFTRASVYDNMVISAMPHDEDNSMHNAITLSVKLTEVVTVKYTEGDAPTVDNPSSPKNSSTVDGGNKQSSDISSTAESTKKESVLHSWLS